MPEIALEIEVLSGPVTVIRPIGYMDSATVPEMEEVFADTVRSGARKIVFDGSRLDYLSSDGLGGILQYIPLLRSGGGDLKLACLHGKAALIVEILGLDRILQVFDSVEKAEEAFEYPLPVEISGAPYYLSTKKGRAVHRPGCRFVSARNRSAVVIFYSLDAAARAGKVFCRICRPG
jgi:anti-sigma B factor antagonist